MKKKQLSKELLQSLRFYDYLIYDPTSKSCVRSTKTGKEVGCIDSKGYWATKMYSNMSGKWHHVRIHRIVVDLCLKIPDTYFEVDHIDRCKTNNRLDNLRIVTSAQNNRNRPMSSANVSGVVGVYKREGHKSRYIATWAEAGRNKSKSFSIKKYGEVKALELAINFRNSKLDLLKDDNIYFDESHYATL